ncbi:hypothetical protein E2C01_022781 [Portunus trituberculatus]|uniref:Uncharacterized protein n=1 Tax=Portunus trituberculatus TaxID=210409 RepID=A0A5B7E6A7_PORTR|nr:hypothetical protein [Portunus trituberculatus]
MLEPSTVFTYGPPSSFFSPSWLAHSHRRHRRLSRASIRLKLASSGANLTPLLIIMRIERRQASGNTELMTF